MSSSLGAFYVGVMCVFVGENRGEKIERGKFMAMFLDIFVLNDSKFIERKTWKMFMIKTRKQKNILRERVERGGGIYGLQVLENIKDKF